MKRLILISIFLIAGFFTTETKAFQPDVNVNFFYSELRPYGEWIQIDYDEYVWRPYNVDRYWTPYSVGRWEYTSYGWYWDSYEPFGWATYHYGRWYYDDYYGWVWLPGSEWGPAWVEWRYSNDYIGWAPLPPYARFDIHLGIHFTISYRSNYHYWNFVTYNRFCNPYINRYFVNMRHKNFIFNNTKYRTNYRYHRGRIINDGINREFIERRSRNKIREREIERTSNLRDYVNTRTRSSNRIINYRPDRLEVERKSMNQKFEARRDNGRSSLRRSMITFRENNKSELKRRDSRFEKRDDMRIERRNNRKNENRSWFENRRNNSGRKIEIDRRSNRRENNSNIFDNRGSKRTQTRSYKPAEKKGNRIEIRRNKQRNENRSYNRSSNSRKENSRSSSHRSVKRKRK